MTIQAGDVPTAAELRALGEIVQTVEKTTNENVASSTTFQDDDELLIAGLTAGTYEISAEVWYTGTSAANQDIKIRFAWPAGSGGTITWSAVGLYVDWSNVSTGRDVEVIGVLRETASPTSSGSFGTVTSSDRPLQIKGRMTIATTGSLVLQWTQNTSNATNTTVKAGSWLTLRKVA